MCCVSLKALLYQFIAQSPNASLQISQISHKNLILVTTYFNQETYFVKESHYCFGMRVVLNMYIIFK